ncbi:MAG: adenylosuccinate lyase [Bacteroidetes bacterium]|nr:adenylosuccinate lyase [Bacteroidota bacterium]
MPTELKSISPVDGRYRGKVAILEEYFSEFALIKYRIRIEIEYLIHLSDTIPQIEAFSEETRGELRKLYLNFNEVDAQAVKDIEKVTNHDVKAVEYLIKDRIANLVPDSALEFVHFGLTSQDINNTATPLSLKEAHESVLLPELASIVTKLKEIEDKCKDITMLAKTHGQPASPTKLGKEFRVYSERIEQQLMLLSTIPFAAKFGGATGNFNAHLVAYPETDWISFGNDFVNNILGLIRSQTTTQIEHYDHLAALFHNYTRINTILVDLCRDIWTYISMDYFKQKLKEGEIGSSAMPHKVNPIDFENAEGNLGIANALYNHLATKLPISRLQRDLTDSTVLRNIGVPMAHTMIAFKSIMKGLGKLIVNEAAINADLEKNWAVVAEAIQTVLRREGFEKPYEALKALTRTNEAITQDSIHNFIANLNVSPQVKEELMEITPFSFTGYN